MNHENEPKVLRHELAKREMRLAQLSNELKKLKSSFEEHRDKRMECESKLKNLRKKSNKRKNTFNWKNANIMKKNLLNFATSI
jgi:predicted  nucleic acid-binding Zn-ribbon protein